MPTTSDVVPDSPKQDWACVDHMHLADDRSHLGAHYLGSHHLGVHHLAVDLADHLGSDVVADPAALVCRGRSVLCRQKDRTPMLRPSRGDVLSVLGSRHVSIATVRAVQVSHQVGGQRRHPSMVVRLVRRFTDGYLHRRWVDSVWPDDAWRAAHPLADSVQQQHRAVHLGERH